MKRNTLVMGVVLFILAVFCWAGWANWEYRKQAAERLLAPPPKAVVVTSAPAGPPQYVSPLVGKPAPAFTLEDLNGRKVSLTTYKGRAVLINFWATWCAPCKIETPWLIELRNQYAADGFEILGVSMDDLDRDDPKKLADEKSEIASFTQEMRVFYPVLIDGGTLSDAYGGLDELPTSVFVDRNGNVIAAQLGLTSKADLEGNIKKAMGEGK